MTTELVLRERARVALRAPEYETQLTALAEGAASITAITNAAGLQQCHATRMALKRGRIELEKTAKTARDDAQLFARAVIAEEKRLIAIIAPEETRLGALQDAWEAAREAERLAKVEAERQRVAAIRRRIDTIASQPMTMISLPAEQMRAIRNRIAGLIIDDVVFDEFVDEARAVRQATLETMADMIAKQDATEANAARLASERAELERAKRAEDERNAAERTRIAQEQHEAAVARAKADAEAKVERDRLAAEDAERRQAAAAALAEQQRKIDAEREEVARQKREAAAAERVRREQAEAERLRMVTSDPVRALREIKRICDAGWKANVDSSLVLEDVDAVVSAAIQRIDEAAP